MVDEDEGREAQGRGVLRASVSGQHEVMGSPMGGPGPPALCDSCLTCAASATDLHPPTAPTVHVPTGAVCAPANLPAPAGRQARQPSPDAANGNGQGAVCLQLRSSSMLETSLTSYTELSARMDVSSEDATDDGGLEEGPQEQMLGMPRE